MAHIQEMATVVSYNSYNVLLYARRYCIITVSDPLISAPNKACLVRSRDQWIRYSDAQVSILTLYVHRKCRLYKGAIFVHSFILHLWQENVCFTLYTSPMAVVVSKLSFIYWEKFYDS